MTPAEGCKTGVRHKTLGGQILWALTAGGIVAVNKFLKGEALILRGVDNVSAAESTLGKHQFSHYAYTYTEVLRLE